MNLIAVVSAVNVVSASSSNRLNNKIRFHVLIAALASI